MRIEGSIIHKIQLLIICILFTVTAIVFGSKSSIPEVLNPVVALFGILSVIGFLAMPVIVIKCGKTIVAGVAKPIDVLCFVVSFGLMLLEVFVVWRLWPALMGV